jgi:hypothetical protein
MLLKRLGAAVLGVSVTVAITGCLQITAQDNAQTDAIGPLHLTTTLCTTNNSGGPSPDAASGCAPASGSPEELVLAYLVPTAITAPATVRLTTSDGPLSMTSDPSWAAVAESATPAPAGLVWVGYRSPPFTAGGTTPSTTDPATVTAEADFALPPAAGGGPFASGPVTYRVRMGERDAASPESAPTTCFGGAASRAAARRARRAYARGVRSRSRLARAAGAPSGNTSCGRTPTAPITVATRDLALVPAAAAGVQQGSPVDLAFAAKFAGAAGPTFALGVSGVPGATVAPTLTPDADSTTGVPVHVDVPLETPAGTYDVTLTATSGAQTRSATTQLTVGDAPALTETLDGLPQTTLAQIRAAGQPGTVGCNVACTATVDLLLYKPPADRVGIAAQRKYRAVPTVLLGRVQEPLAAGIKQTVTIPVKDAAKDKLRNLGRFTLVVRTTARDSRGQVTRAIVRKVRLAPGCGSRPGCVPRR